MAEEAAAPGITTEKVIHTYPLIRVNALFIYSFYSCSLYLLRATRYLRLPFSSFLLAKLKKMYE